MRGVLAQLQRHRRRFQHHRRRKLLAGYGGQPKTGHSLPAAQQLGLSALSHRLQTQLAVADSGADPGRPRVGKRVQILVCLVLPRLQAILDACAVAARGPHASDAHTYC
jgi:hypothetical protein